MEDVRREDVGGVTHTDSQDCVLWRSLCDATHSSVGVLCVMKEMGVTHRDDIQDAEEAVDTVSGVNLLHHTFFAILGDGRKTYQAIEFWHFVLF